MNYLRKNKLQFVLLFSMLMLGVIAAIVYGKITTKETIAPPGYFDVKFHQNKIFPTTDLTSFESGLNLTSEISQGKTLLVYMQTGCAGCKVEADILAQNDFYQKYGVKVYIVGFEDYDQWTKFKNDHKLNYPVFYDKDHKLRISLGVESFPASFFISNGKIERSWVGTNKNATVKDVLGKMGLLSDNS